jgi:hypothetical protein
MSATAWRKSSRSSDPDMAQCVEVAAIYEVSDSRGA